MSGYHVAAAASSTVSDEETSVCALRDLEHAKGLALLNCAHGESRERR
jgi:hypothetical protein